MKTVDTGKGWKPWELPSVAVGFVLVGIAVAVTTVSYVTYMKFQYQWLVWGVGIVFAAVAVVLFEWLRALPRTGEAPEGTHRRFLLLSIPLAYVVSSQVCGLGTEACNALCHVTNITLIGLATVAAVRLARGHSVGGLLIPLVGISLIPHCTCYAPINKVWHGLLWGVAPTCEMVPLAAVLFALAALRGVRTRGGTALVLTMYGVMLFIIVGGSLFGFPWEGCAAVQVTGR